MVGLIPSPSYISPNITNATGVPLLITGITMSKSLREVVIPDVTNEISSIGNNSFSTSIFSYAAPTSPDFKMHSHVSSYLKTSTLPIFKSLVNSSSYLSSNCSWVKLIACVILSRDLNLKVVSSNLFIEDLLALFTSDRFVTNYSLILSTYDFERVSIFILSPVLTKIGTLIFAPVSVVAGFMAVDEDVSPFIPGSL